MEYGFLRRSGAAKFAGLFAATKYWLLLAAFGLFVGAGAFFLLNEKYLNELEEKARAGEAAQKASKAAQTEAANKVLAAVRFAEFLFDTNPRSRAVEMMSPLSVSEKISKAFFGEHFTVQDTRRWDMTSLELVDGADTLVEVRGIQYGPFDGEERGEGRRVSQRMYFLKARLGLRSDLPPRAAAGGYIGNGVYEVTAFIVRDQQLNVVARAGEIE